MNELASYIIVRFSVQVKKEKSADCPSSPEIKQYSDKSFVPLIFGLISFICYFACSTLFIFKSFYQSLYFYQPTYIIYHEPLFYFTSFIRHYSFNLISPILHYYYHIIPIKLLIFLSISSAYSVIIQILYNKKSCDLYSRLTLFNFINKKLNNFYNCELLVLYISVFDALLKQLAQITSR